MLPTRRTVFPPTRCWTVVAEVAVLDIDVLVGDEDALILVIIAGAVHGVHRGGEVEHLAALEQDDVVAGDPGADPLVELFPVVGVQDVLEAGLPRAFIEIDGVAAEAVDLVHLALAHLQTGVVMPFFGVVAEPCDIAGNDDALAAGGEGHALEHLDRADQRLGRGVEHIEEELVAAHLDDVLADALRGVVAQSRDDPGRIHPEMGADGEGGQRVADVMLAADMDQRVPALAGGATDDVEALLVPVHDDVLGIIVRLVVLDRVVDHRTGTGVLAQVLVIHVEHGHAVVLHVIDQRGLVLEDVLGGLVFIQMGRADVRDDRHVGAQALGHALDVMRLGGADLLQIDLMRGLELLRQTDHSAAAVVDAAAVVNVERAAEHADEHLHRRGFADAAGDGDDLDVEAVTGKFDIFGDAFRRLVHSDDEWIVGEKLLLDGAMRENDAGALVQRLAAEIGASRGLALPLDDGRVLAGGDGRAEHVRASHVRRKPGRAGDLDDLAKLAERHVAQDVAAVFLLCAFLYQLFLQTVHFPFHDIHALSCSLVCKSVAAARRLKA